MPEDEEEWTPEELEAKKLNEEMRKYSRDSPEYEEAMNRWIEAVGKAIESKKKRPVTDIMKSKKRTKNYGVKNVTKIKCTENPDKDIQGWDLCEVDYSDSTMLLQGMNIIDLDPAFIKSIISSDEILKIDFKRPRNMWVAKNGIFDSDPSQELSPREGRGKFSRTGPKVERIQTYRKLVTKRTGDL